MVDEENEALKESKAGTVSGGKAEVIVENPRLKLYAPMQTMILEQCHEKMRQKYSCDMSGKQWIEQSGTVIRK